MAINIFEKTIEKSAPSTAKYLAESLQYCVMKTQNSKKMIELVNSDEAKKLRETHETVITMDAETHELKIHPLEDSLDLTDQIPILLSDYEKGNHAVYRATIEQKLVHFMNNSQDEDIIENFANELDNLRVQILDIESGHEDAEDLDINIAVYPTLKDVIQYIHDHMHRPGEHYQIYENNMRKANARKFLEDVYKVIAITHIKTIKRSQAGEESLDIANLDKTQYLLIANGQFTAETIPFKQEAK